jgi:hypothetical protein
MKNHYFIGIGGTGGNILREIRKTMFLRQREVASGIKAEFLYVDSNDQELNSNRWRVLGNSVQLDSNQRLGILDGNLAQTVNNVGQNPGITGWIGDRTSLLNLIAGASGVPGAQQRRRFGRFLFSVHAQEFINRVRMGVERILASDREVTNECTFHLMGTLAGGTGSGGLVDAILQLRKAFPNAGTHPIKLYCLINDNAPRADVGYFYPNQYAALKDINAILCGKANFHDVLCPHGDRCTGNTPLLVCYLTSHTNESTIALTKERQERLIAEWIVEVTNSESAGRMDPQHLKILTGEDILSTFPGEPAVNPQRSYAFASLGIRRWAIPQTLLRERLSHAVAETLADQLLHCNWQNGYKGQPLASNSARFLQDNHPESLGLDYRNFADPEARNGTGIDAEYSLAMRNLKERVLGENSAIQQLERLADEFLRTGFQGRGAVSFFGTRETQITAEVSALAGEICNRLQSAMSRREVGIEDVIACLEAYLKHLDMQFVQIDSEEDSRRRLSDDAVKRLADIRSSARKVGFLGRIFGAEKRLLDQAGLAMATNLSAKTWLLGCATARRALQQVKQTLQSVLVSCVGFRSVLVSLRGDLADKRLKAINHLSNPDDLMKVLWDSEAVDRLEHQILASRHQIDTAAQKTFNEFLQPLSLWEFHKLVDVREQITESLVRNGDEAGLDVHDQIAASDPGRRLLDENIVNTLKRQFAANDEGLREEIEAFVRGAVTALKLNGAAVQPRATLGAQAPQMPKKGILLLIPQCDMEPEFRQKLHDIFKGCIVADLVVEESNDISEITLLAANRWLAARFADPLASLKEKYLSATRTKQLAADYFCHLDAESQDLPDLFAPDTATVRAESLRWINLARRLAIIKSSEDGKLVLLKKDAQGILRTEELGTLDQLQAFPDARIETISGEIQRIAADISRNILETLDLTVLAEQKSLPQKVDPTRSEYKQELDGLEWIRIKIKALLGK